MIIKKIFNKVKKIIVKNLEEWKEEREIMEKRIIIRKTKKVEEIIELLEVELLSIDWYICIMKIYIIFYNIILKKKSKEKVL